MKIKVDYLEKGMTIIFKGEKHVITDLIQCGTTQRRIWVDDMKFTEPCFRTWSLEKEIEVLQKGG